MGKKFWSSLASVWAFAGPWHRVGSGHGSAYGYHSRYDLSFIGIGLFGWPLPSRVHSGTGWRRRSTGRTPGGSDGRQFLLCDNKLAQITSTVGSATRECVRRNAA
jgi:hypothetical protein